MHETLKKLYRDHANFYKLLDLLGKELDTMESKGSVSALMKELVSYTRNYSDSIHHPIEDQLYQLLLSRSDEGQEDMDRLLGHHQILMQMTRELDQALTQGTDSTAILNAGRDYLSQQREHMKYEEEKAFPLLKNNLDAKDFEYASGALPADEDPLTVPLMQKEYPNLFAALN